jgi:hypothetical protein
VAATLMASMGPVRILAAERVLLGSALVISPATLAHVAAGNQSTPPTWIARVLGLRLLTQGMAELAFPRPRVFIAGSVIDVLHAVSMLAPAVVAPRYRRIALTSAAEAAVAATVAALTVRNRSER